MKEIEIVLLRQLQLRTIETSQGRPGGSRIRVRNHGPGRRSHEVALTGDYRLESESQRVPDQLSDELSSHCGAHRWTTADIHGRSWRSAELPLWIEDRSGHASSSLRYALLGLLAEEPASGYDLTKKFERMLQRYAWHAQHSQIYPELNRMAVDVAVLCVFVLPNRVTPL